MRLIKLKNIILAAFGSALRGLSGLLIILPLAGAIQAAPVETLPTAASRSSSASSTRLAEPAAELPPIVEGNPLAGRQAELLPSEPSSVEPSSGEPSSVGPRGSRIRFNGKFAGPAYGQEAIDYLTEVGFGVEYGSSSTVLHKWTEDVNLRVYGSPTPTDVAILTQVVAELTELIRGIVLTVNDGRRIWRCILCRNLNSRA